MLGQENIREQVAVGQMDVDGPPTGEQNCEGNLSSELEYKLHCRSHESSKPSSASSDSQHSELTDGESVIEIANAASDKVIIKEVANCFVQTFVKEFEKKVRESSEEAKPNSNIKKSGKLTATADSIIKSSVGPGVGLPSVNPISSGGQSLYVVPKKVMDSCLEKRHRKKAKVISKVIHSFKCNQREILVKAGLEIFQKFEEQFTRVVDVGEYIQRGSEERAIQKLAIEAVYRVMDYASDCGNVEKSFFDFITKGIVLGKSKRETVAKRLHLGPAGYQVQDRQSSETWLTSALYKSVGIEKIEDGTTKYYRLKKCHDDEKYGYRLAFPWELEECFEVNKNYKLVGLPNKKSYVRTFNDEKKEKLAPVILKELNEQDLINTKAIVGIEEHLRRQDENRCQFSYDFGEIVKFFIERKKVTKELNLKLHSKSQEIKMSRIVLINGKSGVGKTEFVRGYGFSERRKGTWGKIIWIDALEHATLKNSFSKLAGKLGIPTKESEGGRDIDIESIVEDVYRHLQYTKSFFVFDRASSYEEIERFLPANFPSLLNGERPFIVITSNKSWQKEGIEEIELGDFDPKESDEFFRKALEKNESQDDISKLGKALNYHPFALAQAAASINQRGESISSYLEKYKTMQKSSGLQGDNGKSFGILKINIDKIKEEKNIGPQSYAMLEFMAYLNSYPINIKEFFFPGKSKENQKKIWYALGRLDSYSLIHLKKGIAQIHQTTQEFMRLRQKEEGKEEETLRKIIISLRNSNITTISHIVSVWNHVSKYKSLVNDFVNLAYHKGYNILHLLAKDGNEEVIRLILEKIGQDELSEVINATDRIGLTPLYYAIIDDNLEVVKFLIEKGAELIVNDEYSIHCAAMFGSLKVVKYFINEKYFNLDELGEQCESPLAYAIKFDQLSVIKYLIKKGADVKLLDDEEIMHLFYYAFEPGNLDIAQYLVRNLNGVNLRSEGGESLLHYAAMYGSSYIVEYLVQNGANVNLPDHDGKSPLCYALMSGDLDIIKYLLKNGANVNLPDHDGKSPLYYAATSGDLDIVKYLVQNGANVSLRDENIITLLFCAVKDGALNVIKCLVEIGVDINQCDKYHFRPLYYIAVNGDLDIVKYLVQNGANVSLRDENIITLLFCAVKDGALNVIKCLVEIGVDINQCDHHISPLHCAAEKGRLNVVKFLIERKADLNRQDEKGGSPLHYAIQADHFNTARYLLVKGANIDLVDKDNHNPLYFTTFSNILAILCPLWQKVDVTPFNNSISFLSLPGVQLLIEIGVNVNQYDKHDMNLLHYAAIDGRLSIIEYLIKKGADVNACGGKYDVKPLHYAAMNGHLNIVEKLIEEGANVNACDKCGTSPLHYAAMRGHFDVVVHLVENKADINLYDECSKKPLHYSIENCHLNSVDYLTAQEGNVNPAHEQSQVSMKKRLRVSELQDCTLPYSVNGQCVSSKRRRLENVRETSLDNQEAVNPSLDTTISLIALEFKLQDDKMQRFTQLGKGDSREPQQPVDNSVPISSLSGIVIEPGNNKVSVQPSGIRDNRSLYRPW
ncbi:ankyrin repeat domain-containing protein [Wolbachia endosymbiont (group B) of Idaea biselata]|uniref:ankyrin repeat domain-containing protein n=1 Tax=Wolbachia endosymbiont (group B) of Idaea biselata TaxID=3066179 RepID=UPI00313308E5